MKRGVTNRIRVTCAVIAAVGVGVPWAYGQTTPDNDSARAAASSGRYERANVISIPTPKAITVSARPVARGEIAIFDPITVDVGSVRTIPATVRPQDPLSLSVAAQLGGVEIDMPNPIMVNIGAQLGTVDVEVPTPRTIDIAVQQSGLEPVRVSEPFIATLHLERRAPVLPSVEKLFEISVASEMEPIADLDIRDPDRLAVGGERGAAEDIEIGEPIEIAVASNRIPLSVADAEAAIAACNFESVRAHLRRLVAVSDQLDSEGRKVVAELSRVNRANTAFETARMRYDEGQLEDAKTLLVLAEQTDCEAREAAVEEALRKIERLNDVLARVDGAIAACNTGAMTSLHEQLQGQTHKALTARMETLSVMAEPANFAAQQISKIDTAITKGRLEDANAALTAAEEQFASIPGRGFCVELSEQMSAQRRQVDHLMDLASRADGAVAVCNLPAMTALSRELEPETNVLMVENKAIIDEMNAPASAAQTFFNGSRVPFERGQLDEAEALLNSAQEKLDQIANREMCPEIRNNVSRQLAEIKRVRRMVADADAIIMACRASGVADIVERLSSEKHILLADRRVTISLIRGPVAAAQQNLDRASSLYDEGSLDNAQTQAKAALGALVAVEDLTECEPLRKDVDQRLASIENVRQKIAESDRAIAACNVSEMRSLAADLEDAPHVLLVGKRQALLNVGEPVADASSLNDDANTHYLAGRLEDAETALRTATERLAEIESCDPLKQVISGRLGKIDRMRGVLVRVDDAVAACDISAMTAMAPQLENQSHTLLADRFARVMAVNASATAAEIARRQARQVFDAGDLATARNLYGESQSELAKIDAELCDEIRTDIGNQLAAMDVITEKLAKTDAAIAACNLPGLRTVESELGSESYILLVQAKQRVTAVADPLASAESAHAGAQESYISGDLDQADGLRKRAESSLGNIDRATCIDLRQQVANTAGQIKSVRSLVAEADKTMAACRIGGLDALNEKLASVEHRLLRSKQAEIESYYRPVSAAANLGEAAEEHYFEGNIDVAQTRLLAARQELENRPNCRAIFEQIDRRIERIAKIRRTLAHVNRAIEACHIPAMSSMSRQLDGQNHVLLAQKKADLDRVMVPASTAQRRNVEAWPMFENGQLVAAQTRLEQALDQLDQIANIDRSLCIPLRREIEARLDETDRVRSTLVLVDSALASCNHADMDLLTANLQNATHTSLVRALQDLKAGRLRCGLSDEEKLAQAETTCGRKHPNSIVDEFNPQTGRYTCVCPNDFMWDPVNAACVSRANIQEASNQVCESGYANSVAVHIRGPSQFECNCRDGFVWNEDETGCVSAEDVVQTAVNACAAEGGYPAEIEGAGRFTCCPDDTIWNRTRRECVKTDEMSTAATGADPQCRWVASAGSAISNEYFCTCDEEELCGPHPENGTSTPISEGGAALSETPDATVEPAVTETSTTESVEGEQPEGGFVNRIKKLFGNMF